MTDSPSCQWDPARSMVQHDQIAAYDALRNHCPLAHSELMGWSLLRHADVMRTLRDHHTFSSTVSSSHVSVPNGMDPPRHTEFRRIIDPYFEAPAMRAFAPTCRRLARDAVRSLAQDGEVEVMESLARPFALQVQGAFLGWDRARLEPIGRWVKRQQAAAARGDRAAMSALAREYDSYIRAILDERRQSGDQAPGDVTTRLVRETIDDCPLIDEEIISILRNWTVGELGTIAAAIGILVEYLAARPGLQQQLRTQPELLAAAIDEILRINAPLIANRRITTCPVEIGGRRFDAGERLTILWASANRDEEAFGDPDAFRPEQNASRNLLYGAGIHACPGAPLARMELRCVMEELFAATASITQIPGREAVHAIYPAGGFSEVWVSMQPLDKL